MITVSEIIKSSKVSNFKYYIDGDLWYETDQGFLFPVPIEDIGTATFNATEKTLLLMRYIRKWYDKVQAERVKYNDDLHNPG